jgi:hypothetical protein
MKGKKGVKGAARMGVRSLLFLGGGSKMWGIYPSIWGQMEGQLWD